MKSLVLSFSFIICAITLSAQSAYQLPGSRSEHISDRLYIMGLDMDRMSSIRNVERRSMARSAARLLYDGTELSVLDHKDLKYLRVDNSEYSDDSGQGISDDLKKVYTDSSGTFYYYDKSMASEIGGDGIPTKSGVFGLFYKDRANFYQVNTEHFKLRANPLIHITMGKDQGDDRNIIRNTRGAEVRGLIDDKIYFYTSIVDNQRSYLRYANQRIQDFDAVTGHGTYKDFESSVLGDFEGYDYFDARGYVGLDVSDHVALELGHGKHFIGNGMRSLLLSDSGDDYFYVKLNTRIWKLQYQNIWAELNSLSFRSLPGDRLLTKKFMATHYLAYKITPKFEVGLFESVIFDRQNQFELQYLNPMIFYRVVESGLGSPDNVLLGLNMSYTFGEQFQAYGQTILDEFKLSEVKAGSGWWANKYGFQTGLKYYNALDVDHLDLQLEYNTVRPYTYSHGRELSVLPAYSNASYSHHSQPLAHPLGANFKEVLGSVKYQWGDKIFVHARAMLSSYGEDGPGDNFGGNILLLNDSRNFDEGNEVGQGLATDILSLGLDVSYQFMHNYNIDLNVLYRKSDSERAASQIDTKYVGIGLRINMDRENIDY